MFSYPKKMVMNKCVACDHEGKMAMADYIDVVYQTTGRNISVRLCYHHSVELFKRGQTNFSFKYKISKKDKSKKEHDSISNFVVFNSFR